MAEHTCVVSYCCCGCGLRGGSLSIGIIILILSLLNCALDAYNAVKTGLDSLWVSFAINLFLALVSCLLLHGIQTSRAGLVMAWVWTMVVLIVINIIMSIIVIATTTYLAYGLIHLAVMALYIYLVVVVRSYAVSLENGYGVLA